MSTTVIERENLVQEAQRIAQAAKGRGDDLSADEMRQIDNLMNRISDIDSKSASQKSIDDRLAALGQNDGAKSESKAEYGSLGEHFVKSAGESQLAALKGTSQRLSVGAPEFVKADPVATTDHGDLHPQVDTSVVRGFRERPTIASWIGSGTLTATGITYYVENGSEGGFEAVAEGGHKPALGYNYAQKTDSLTKIAGHIKINDEMFEDLSFLVSEINGRLLYDLVIAEESQVLSGSGTAPNLEGILNREGVQTASAEGDPADAIFRALTSVQTATGLTADGIVIHPLDYQDLRLRKDSNGQYFAGGFFTGAYGTGGVTASPGIWGMNTIVTTAIPQGTALVGAGKQGATLYRKGGVRVEATNSNEDDFVHNRVTVRGEERVALAVRRPSAFVKVTGLGGQAEG